MERQRDKEWDRKWDEKGMGGRDRKSPPSLTLSLFLILSPSATHFTHHHLLTPHPFSLSLRLNCHLSFAPCRSGRRGGRWQAWWWWLATTREPTPSTTSLGTSPASASLPTRAATSPTSSTTRRWGREGCTHPHFNIQTATILQSPVTPTTHSLWPTEWASKLTLWSLCQYVRLICCPYDTHRLPANLSTYIYLTSTNANTYTLITRTPRHYHP